MRCRLPIIAPGPPGKHSTEDLSGYRSAGSLEVWRAVPRIFAEQPMQCKISSRTQVASVLSPADAQADLDLVIGPFAEFLRKQGYLEHTVHRYQRHLVRAAKRLARDGARLTGLTRGGLSALLREMSGGRASASYRNEWRAALRRWLKFNGTFQEKPQTGWIGWVDDFERFLIAHRGLAASTCALCRYFMYDYLRWQFGRRTPDWARVRPRDLWTYAGTLSRRVQPATVNRGCSVLRAFFRFLHVRGHGPQSLIDAVPTIASYAASYHPGVLSAARSRRLLAASRHHPSEGSRNFAMLLCLSELGLRCVEVTKLRMSDVDLSRGSLMVSPVKGGPHRQLPLPGRVADALRRYVTRDRPASTSDALFLRHNRRRGQPVTADLLGDLVQRLYQRCGFPAGWTGPHRLRHTFATRLFQRGASLKEIADWLGHRRLQTSRRYTHLDLAGLRSLARPWPR